MSTHKLLDLDDVRLNYDPVVPQARFKDAVLAAAVLAFIDRVPQTVPWPKWPPTATPLDPAPEETDDLSRFAGYDVIDPVIAQNVRFNCTTQFESQPWAIKQYPALAPSAAAVAAISLELIAVNASRLPDSPQPTVWHDVTDAVLTTDFCSFDDSSNHYKLVGLGRMCDMGDAVIAQVIQQQFPGVQFYSIRNASGRQVPNSNNNIEEARKQSAEIYAKYGALTPAGSVIATWAVIAATIKTSKGATKHG